MERAALFGLILSLSKDEVAAPSVDASRFDKLSMKRTEANAFSAVQP